MRTKTERQFEVPNISYTLIFTAGSLERTFTVKLMRTNTFFYHCLETTIYYSPHYNKCSIVLLTRSLGERALIHMHNQVQYETDKEKGAPKLEPQCIYKARGRHEKRERERERGSFETGPSICNSKLEFTFMG
jgi:hypothetical protein